MIVRLISRPLRIVAAMLVIVAGERGLAQTTAPATQPGEQAALVPCLVVAADGSHVRPGSTLTSSKRTTVAFQLPADTTAKTLKSRWIALDDGSKTIAENTLELKGQKTGWLRLSLKQPAPPGKYRLETTLDDKTWETIDLEIVAPPTEGLAKKPSDLIPLTEGKTMHYELHVRPATGTKVEVPGVAPGPDGSTQTTITFGIGKTEDAGTHYQVRIGGKATGEMWVKLDEHGLRATRSKVTGKDAQQHDPPLMIQPLPPSLEDGVEWKVKRPNGDDLAMQLLGPIVLEGPDGPAAGYLVFSDQQTAHDSPGTDAVRGRETVERYYIPGVGLVREVHVQTMSGKLTSRQEITLSKARPYRLVKDEQMKGRLGRVRLEYPPETSIAQARITVFKDRSDTATASGYGEATFELMPGAYEVGVNGKRVPVEVKSGHETVPSVGVLRIHAGASTRFRVLDADGETELTAGYGEADVALPAGDYTLSIAGANEPVKVEDGKVTEF